MIRHSLTSAASVLAIAFAAEKGTGDAASKTSEVAAAQPPADHPGALTVINERTEITLPNGVKLKAVKAVSRPTLKHESDTTLFITVNAEFRKDENQDGKDIFIATVTNLEDGREYNYVLNAITVSELADNYPAAKDDPKQIPAYVGKSFAVTKGGVVQGKRYKAVAIMEIEVGE